jgi:uncharacterized protein YebE (UPF0316 family)
MNLGNLIEYYQVPQYGIAIMIFFARVIDVSIGTLRIMVVSKGRRLLASTLGFFEVFIWLIAITQVLQNLNGILSYVMYSAGFAAGTFTGMTIERRLSLGKSIVRIIVPRNETSLVDDLIEQGFGVTHLHADGSKGPVEIIFSVVDQGKLRDILGLVKRRKPAAFYTVEDVRMARDYDSARNGNLGRFRLLQPFYWFRKGK